MKIPVTLNGTKTIFESNADDSLMKVLHKNSCPSVKEGCGSGFCGSCTVLLDDKPVASCKIPAGIVKGNEIVTLEAFSKTEDYDVIIQGFNKAGIKLCGYCNAGKIFAAYKILHMQKMPSRQEITENIKNLSPCCTDIETLVNGIIYAIQIENKRSKRVN